MEPKTTTMNLPEAYSTNGVIIYAIQVGHTESVGQSDKVELRGHNRILPWHSFRQPFVSP